MPFDRKIIAEFITLTKRQFLKKKYDNKVEIIRGAYTACGDKDEKLIQKTKRLNLEAVRNPKIREQCNLDIFRIEKEIKVIRHEGQILQDLFEGHRLKGNTVFRDYAEKYLEN